MSTKVFVGNLKDGTTDEDVRVLFEPYGQIVECDVIGNYGFVHMSHADAAHEAINALNGYMLYGNKLNVELSTPSTQGKKRTPKVCNDIKIFIGNVKPGTPTDEMRELFTPYGNVTECDVLGNFGFVHMESEADAKNAIRDLNGYMLNGCRLNVEQSTGDTRGRRKQFDNPGPRGTRALANWSKSRGRFDPYGDNQRSESMRGGGGGGAGGGDSFARDLLALYTRNPAMFDAYARDPRVRESLGLEPVETVRVPEPFYRTELYERRLQSGVSELGLSAASGSYLSGGLSFPSLPRCDAVLHTATPRLMSFAPSARGYTTGVVRRGGPHMYNI